MFRSLVQRTLAPTVRHLGAQYSLSGAAAAAFHARSLSMAPQRPKGMLSVEQLKSQIMSEEVETVIMCFPDCYGRLMGKRFDGDFFLQSALKDGTHACVYLLTVDMDQNPVEGYSYANWETGYGDFHMVPDLNTIRTCDWLDKTVMVMCDLQDNGTHEPIAVAPRSVLNHQVALANKLGFGTVRAASELEYYLFNTSYKDAAHSKFANLDPAGWYVEDYHILQATREEPFNARARRSLKRSGIPVETTKGEAGIGQHELNVTYADAVTMADNHSVYKQCLKEIADDMGMSITFMAKPYAHQPGSSCHVHLSLADADGNNAFFGDKEIGNGIKCSDHFRHFLAGWIKYSHDLMPFYAPNVNSYKRYSAASWAPTAAAWSFDNRTAGFRVVGSGQSLRIECRVPGADANPYLCFAASLASGLEGIKQKLEPPEIVSGNFYNLLELDHVPKTLDEAVDNFEKSEFARKAFTDEVVDHYSHFFRSEMQDFSRVVTDWEMARYFERV